MHPNRDLSELRVMKMLTGKLREQRTETAWATRTLHTYARSSNTAPLQRNKCTMTNSKRARSNHHSTASSILSEILGRKSHRQ